MPRKESFDVSGTASRAGSTSLSRTIADVDNCAGRNTGGLDDLLEKRRRGIGDRVIAVFLERGPWGRAHAMRPEASLARVRLRSLAGLPGALTSWHAPG